MRGKADKSTLEDQESDQKTNNGASSNKMENVGVILGRSSEIRT